MLLDDWQRIEKIVRWTGLSVNSFALSIGLNRSENLYRIKRGDNGISKELAELIAARYPEISRAWIITGEGGMFIGNTEERNLIPAYDIDALTLAGMERFPEASYVLSLPRAEHVTFAALMLNKAMEPEIPVGSVIYVKAVSPETVEEGDIIAFTSGVSVISHRVVSNQTVEGKFTTKGDANAENDMNPVGYADLIGRVEFHLPVLGAFLAILTSTIGKVYVLTLGACGVMLNILAGRMRGRV